MLDLKLNFLADSVRYQAQQPPHLEVKTAAWLTASAIGREQCITTKMQKGDVRRIIESVERLFPGSSSGGENEWLLVDQCDPPSEQSKQNPAASGLVGVGSWTKK